MHCGASVWELYGALVFHSTTYSHLHTSHITSFPCRSSPPPTVACKTTGRNAWGRGYVGYQIYAGVCGAMVCANLGFTVHTLCHYCYCCRQQGLKAFGGGLKSCKSTSWYEQIYSVDFLCLQLIHILALSPQVMVYSAWTFAEHIQLWNRGRSLSYGVRVV